MALLGVCEIPFPLRNQIKFEILGFYIFFFLFPVLLFCFCITGERVKLQDCGPKVGTGTSYKGAQVIEADLSGQQRKISFYLNDQLFPCCRLQESFRPVPQLQSALQQLFDARGVTSVKNNSHTNKRTMGKPPPH